MFDALGRQTADVVSLRMGNPHDIDDAVLRIDRACEVRGMLEKTTSYSSAQGGSGNVVNEVFDEYDEWGMLAKEYQSHDGEVNTGSTPYVEYHHAAAADGLRLEWVGYPNGRKVHYTYGAANEKNDVLNRLEAIKDDNGGVPDATLASYTYLGLGTIVIEDYESIAVKLDLWGGTSGTCQGFDPFGRIVDQAWIDYSTTPTAIDEYEYAYDLAGNRISRTNEKNHNLDEAYEYDAVNRLVAWDVNGVGKE